MSILKAAKANLNLKDNKEFKASLKENKSESKKIIFIILLR